MKPRGYVALVSVLLVGAIGVVIATTLLLLGLGHSRTSFSAQQSTQARGLANACAEDALQRVRSSNGSFTRTQSLTLPTGTGTLTVTTQGGQTRTVEATGTAGSVVRRVKITITSINPLI